MARTPPGEAGARRNGSDITVIAPGSLARGGINLKADGGKFSYMSQLVSTSRPTRSGRRVTSTCDIAPPLSLPTIVVPFRSSASRKSAITFAIPGGERSASAFIATRWAPIGQSGRMQRCVAERCSAVWLHSRPSTR